MEAPTNHLHVIFVNPLFTDPRISELEALTTKVIALNPDIVHLRTNPTCGKWMMKLFKKAEYSFTASARSLDDFKCVLIKKTRHSHESTSYYSGTDFDAYQILIKDKLTNKVNAVGFAVISELCITIDERINGDKILKKKGLEKWFDLDKELEKVVKAKVDTVPWCNTDDVLYSNLKKLLPVEEETKKEPKSEHHGIAALIHKVIDKKEPVKQLPPKKVIETMNLSTIFCKIRMQHHAASAHVIDNGETFHQMKLGDVPNRNTMPSINHTTF